ncbi:tetratricopeptide repeat protein [Methylophilus methylotrophus]|uniref:tetratricopeptide repeat protein n=1 Tax=Methylophilus methylotrophus TaxID=17 RepID=UPI000F5A7D0C|nr:tetratricopeptide repeat protein [Methylophilus methylotrophus]
MSLINQVLQNVEARGSAVLDGRPEAAGWDAQVKPVLLHQGTSAHAWIKWLLLGCLFLALIAGWQMNGPWLLSYFHPADVTGPASKTMIPKVASPSASVKQPLESMPVQAASPWEPPQLTRSLFSAWQAAGSPASVSPLPVGNKPIAKLAPAAVKTAATQVEGEFTMNPAETVSASPVVSVIEPPLEVANAAKLAKNNEGESGPKGVVNKQVRPDQEVNLLIQRAVDHEQKGRLSEALATLRQALTTYPQSEDARQLLAAYLFESRQEVEAVSVLQAGIKQYPGQIGLAKSLAKWQLSHGQPDAVLQTLKPVANALIQDAESQWMLAMAYQQTAQHAAALPHFERAIALQPGRAQSMVAYAISLQAAGQPTQALQQFQLAYQLPLSDRLSDFVSQRIRQLGGTVTTHSE